MTGATRVGINGFGRIGRLALRAGWGHEDLEFVHVNEVEGGPRAGAHLLEFDSVHGPWQQAITSDDQGLTVGGHTLGWSDAPEPTDVDWRGLGVEVVLECSGRFRTGRTPMPFLERGARSVVVAAPVKDGSGLNVVVGLRQPPRRARRNRRAEPRERLVRCLATLRLFAPEGGGRRVRSRERRRRLPYGITGGPCRKSARVSAGERR